MQLVIIFGPLAVGKMTVGAKLSELTGLPLFHNHLTIDLALRFFPYGSPAFSRLNEEFRRRIFEEVAASDLPGLIFTFVWSLDDPNDKSYIDNIVKMFEPRDARACFAELVAPLETRKERNEGAFRLAEKWPKRDLGRSRKEIVEIEKVHRMNTSGDFFYPDRHLRMDNSDLPPELAARRIAEHFRIPIRQLG